MVRKADVILCLAVVLTMCGAIVLFSMFSPKGDTVVVTSDGVVIGEYRLTDSEETAVIHEEWGYNLVVIEDGRAYVKEADCRDKICVDHTPISRQGEMIVCLPHKVTVEIR